VILHPAFLENGFLAQIVVGEKATFLFEYIFRSKSPKNEIEQ
jgi:hypothetical protein